MYIIERLNEVILTQYHIEIISNVNVFEHPFGAEDDKFVEVYDNPSAKYTSDQEHLTTDLLDYILEYIDLIVGVKLTPQQLKEKLGSAEEPVGFWLSILAKYDGHEPSKAELKKWERGELIIYAHDISIDVVINGSKISNTILFDLMFGGE